MKIFLEALGEKNKKVRFLFWGSMACYFIGLIMMIAGIKGYTALWILGFVGLIIILIDAWKAAFKSLEELADLQNRMLKNMVEAIDKGDLIWRTPELEAAWKEGPPKEHTQDCKDYAFQFHAATGADAECICNPKEEK